MKRGIRLLGIDLGHHGPRRARNRGERRQHRDTSIIKPLENLFATEEDPTGREPWRGARQPQAQRRPWLMAQFVEKHDLLAVAPDQAALGALAGGRPRLNQWVKELPWIDPTIEHNGRCRFRCR